MLSLFVCVYNEDVSIAFGMFLGPCISCLVIFIVTICKKPIEPIEVYRDNTKLRITYQDSIPVDSVVVYKNK